MTKLYHYSKDKLILDKNRCYAEKNICGDKPGGLWISVDYDWQIWCEEEGYRTDRLVNQCEIVLCECEKILFINNKDELLNFTKNFRDKFSDLNRYNDCTCSLDWSSVKSIYKGILIYPYIYECRLNSLTQWYYTWDCASGCIWDLSCIDEVIYK